MSRYSARWNRFVSLFNSKYLSFLLWFFLLSLIFFHCCCCCCCVCLFLRFFFRCSAKIYDYQFCHRLGLLYSRLFSIGWSCERECVCVRADFSCRRTMQTKKLHTRFHKQTGIAWKNEYTYISDESRDELCV